MNSEPATRASYLLVHTEATLNQNGPNSGAEMATLNQARFLAKAGKRVTVAACLSARPTDHDGVEYWDLGSGYDVEAALDAADARGSYHLISAGRAISLFLARKRKNCLSRLLVTHDRTAGDSGIKPHVLSHLVDAVLCVSHAQRDKLVSEGAPADKLHVIHNGVDFSIFDSTPPSCHEPTRLVFSGALVPDKGLHLLLNSFVDLKGKYPNLKLEVFGDASLWARGEYLDIDRLSKAIPDLTFHGKTSQREIADGFKRAGLCVVPSIWFDPFPLTSLEAQACGCPVIAFKVGGLPEGIDNGKSGLIVEDIDQDALTRSLDSLLSDPARIARMSEHAAAFIQENFRWETVARKIISMCEPAGSCMQQPHWYLEEENAEAESHLQKSTQRAIINSLTRNRPV